MQNNYIKVKDIANMAITEEQGFKLRAEIAKVIANTDKYFPQECRNRFILTNLSKAGKHAYRCSFENAEYCFLTSL